MATKSVKKKQQMKAELPVGDVVHNFFAALRKAYKKKYRSAEVTIEERKDRFSVMVDDLTVAAMLKRADSISLYLAKFKPYATSLAVENLVSYGAAGYFFVGASSEIDKAVEVFMQHHEDLRKRYAAKIA